MKKINKSIIVLGLAVLFASGEANATKKVYGPYVEKGELEMEYRGRYEHDDDGDVDGKWVQKFAVGYGFTDYWFSEIYAELEKEGESDAETEFAGVEWENKFQLTEQGEYFVDLGLLTELVYNTTGGADKAELKLLLAKDTGDFSHTANIIGEREFGDGSSHETEVGLAWGTRYRYKPTFEPGFELHSDFGEFNDNSDFDNEKHLLGPVAYGQIGRMKYDIGYLVGLSGASPDGTFKVLLEYEWYF